MLYTAYGKECRITLEQIFDIEWGIRAEYKDEVGVWTYIAMPSFYIEQLTTKEDTDAVYQAALDKINVATKTLLGGGSTEPDSGIDRIQWLVDNKTIVVDNDLKMG